jgi:DNA-binding transcriptional ArsR family regulator
MPLQVNRSSIMYQMHRLSRTTVSQHLARLRRAGLVEAHRRGRRVYHRLSTNGEYLLELFGELGEETPRP